MGNKQVVTTKLSDLCELIVDCPHSTPEWTDSGFIVLRNQNIRNGSLDLSSPSFTDENGYNSRIKRAVPQAGDIVLTREAPMGEVCLIPAGLQCCLGQRQVLLRPMKGVSGEYLFWALQSPFVRHQISWSEGTGTTVSNIRIPVLKAFEIPRWFESEPQIASYLSAIKNKITLNQKINQTLEKMAQALFKSWFVDFDPVIDNALDAGFFEQDLAFSDELLGRAEARRAVRERGDFKPLSEATRQLFPAAFEECAEPSLGLGGWVPTSWKVQTCEDISEKIGMGPFGSNIKVSTFVEDGVPVISGTHLKQVLLEDHDYNFITEEHALKIKNSCVYKGDIIFTHAGNIGQASLIPLESEYDRYMISQRQFYLRPNLKKIKGSYLVYFFHSYDGQHKLLSNASQTGVPSIARPSTHLKSINLLVPDMKVQDVFDSYITGWNKKTMKSREHIISLTSLRDTLLPKLISGVLSLDEIDANHA